MAQTHEWGSFHIELQWPRPPSEGNKVTKTQLTNLAKSAHKIADEQVLVHNNFP